MKYLHSRKQMKEQLVFENQLTGLVRNINFTTKKMLGNMIIFHKQKKNNSVTMNMNQDREQTLKNKAIVK